ncbi:hypothetical protein [Gaetbulibacter aestuarii]|uniref:Lipoprotein n=1 Tax=Gaetbulibacter aestuarii TaxID=1502358 RepID=A0ABW7MZQ4_9FLAO
MKSKFIYLLVAILALNSCSKDSKPADVLPTNTCGVTNPAEDIPWLKERLAYYDSTRAETFFMWQTDYQGETIFVLGTCEGSYNPNYSAFDCEGNHVSITDELNDYLNSVTSKYLIWKPKNFKCNV